MKCYLCWGRTTRAAESISDDQHRRQNAEQPRGLWPHCRCFGVRLEQVPSDRRCRCCRRTQRSWVTKDAVRDDTLVKVPRAVAGAGY